MAGRAILRSHRDGYNVFVKNDGEDYWRIVLACIRENIDQDALMRNYPAKPDIPVSRDGLEMVLKPFVYSNPKRMVFRLDIGDRRFVLKRARMGATGLKRFFPLAMGLSYFTRIMRFVDRAVRAGCTVAQDYFLVAERPLSAFRQEAWILLEYIDGDSLGYNAAPDELRRELTEVVLRLVRNGLTMDDLTLHNFLVVAGREIRAIDISCRLFTRLQAVKMIMKMNLRYGLGIPIRGVRNTIIRTILAARYRLKKAFGHEVE